VPWLRTNIVLFLKNFTFPNNYARYALYTVAMTTAFYIHNIIYTTYTHNIVRTPIISFVLNCFQGKYIGKYLYKRNYNVKYDIYCLYATNYPPANHSDNYHIIYYYNLLAARYPIFFRATGWVNMWCINKY